MKESSGGDNMSIDNEQNSSFH